MRISVKEIGIHKGGKVELCGWVAVRRDHGKLIFIDLRDVSGLAQVVFLPQSNAYETAKSLRSEWVVKIVGKVNERPAAMVNEDMETGKFEIEALEIEVLSESETPPFEIEGEGYDIGEETRMKYRYLDLRRDRLRNVLRERYKVIKFFRDWLDGKGFIEVETPILTKSTPEGARDYLVPSRLQPGNFYALPQSPQQYKQLLMAAGVEKYFQVARCFRDEDTRGDRQPEFTQLDLEMSFVGEEDIMSLTEAMMIDLVTKNFPKKKIQSIPFPIIKYEEAISKYGTDRPDIRTDKEDSDLLAFCWVTDFPFFEKNKDNNNWTFTHNPFSAPKPEHNDWLLNKEKIGEIKASQYDLVLNGFEVGGGSIRSHRPDILRAILEIMGMEEDFVDEHFGHILEAFKYGTPPHGGIAPGIDRLLMILLNEPNIREVMAFPKTGDGRDFMMKAPSKVEVEQLNELGIKIKNKED